MARLVAESGALEGQTFPIDPGLTLGREQHNSVSMPQNRKASREHCKVWREAPNKYAVADFGSTNGTLVNDAKVVRQSLSDGDRIQVGDTIFRFELDEEEKPKKVVSKPTEARPDLAAVLRGDAPISKPKEGTGAVAGDAIEIKQRILQYSKKKRRGSVLGENLSQQAGLGKWVMILLAVAIAVGLFLVVSNVMPGADTTDSLPPPKVYYAVRSRSFRVCPRGS
jgi:pSer/pThr/pTyr-binding forkhead associated (FHA) protein